MEDFSLPCALSSFLTATMVVQPHVSKISVALHYGMHQNHFVCKHQQLVLNQAFEYSLWGGGTVWYSCEWLFKIKVRVVCGLLWRPTLVIFLGQYISIKIAGYVSLHICHLCKITGSRGVRIAPTAHLAFYIYRPYCVLTTFKHLLRHLRSARATTLQGITTRGRVRALSHRAKAAKGGLTVLTSPLCSISVSHL